MEFVNEVLALLTSRAAVFGSTVANLPVALIAAALLFPLLLAAVSRQPLAFFAVLLVICGLVAIDPASASAGALTAAGAYVASVLMGVIAVVAAIRNRRFAAELQRLRADVDRLHQAEERRLLDAINTRAASHAATVSPAVAPAVVEPVTVAPVTVAPVEPAKPSPAPEPEYAPPAPQAHTPAPDPTPAPRLEGPEPPARPSAGIEPGSDNAGEQRQTVRT
jgi:hypothetical protein